MKGKGKWQKSLTAVCADSLVKKVLMDWESLDYCSDFLCTGVPFAVMNASGSGTEVDMSGSVKNGDSKSSQ